MEAREKGLKLMEEAQQLFDGCNYKLARDKFIGAYYLISNGTKRDPNNESFALLKIGNCYYWMSDYLMSLYYLKQCFELVEDLELKNRIINMITVNYLDLGDHEKCREYCDILIHSDFTKAKYQGYTTLGLLTYYQKNYDESEFCYKEALKYSPENELSKVYNCLALTYKEMRDFKSALNSVNLALKHPSKPNISGEIHNTCSEVYIEMNEINEAEIMVIKALKLFTEDYKLGLARANVNLAKICQLRGQLDVTVAKYEEALNFFEEKKILREAAIACYELSNLYEKREDYKTAKEYYGKYKIYSTKFIGKEGEN